MHKNFYASGFLYHIPSQQILLQQYINGDNASLPWSLFGGVILPNESFQSAFQRIIYASLHLKLPTRSIYDVYDYYNTNLRKNNAVVYAEVPTLKHFSSRGKMVFSWVRTKDVDKLSLPQQMKHDITVGRRVINARERSLLEAHTQETTSSVNEA